MIVKIVGFKVNVDRSTCYYKVELEDDPIGEIQPLIKQEKRNEAKLGHYLRLALKKSDFVSVRK